MRPLALVNHIKRYLISFSLRVEGGGGAFVRGFQGRERDKLSTEIADVRKENLTLGIKGWKSQHPRAKKMLEI